MTKTKTSPATDRVEKSSQMKAVGGKVEPKHNASLDAAYKIFKTEKKKENSELSSDEIAELWNNIGDAGVEKYCDKAAAKADKDNEHMVLDLAYQAFRKEMASSEPDLSRQEILDRWEALTPEQQKERCKSISVETMAKLEEEEHSDDPCTQED